MPRHLPSSPTPHGTDPIALIPDSDSLSERRLHRASSSGQLFVSGGYVTASGLSTWRRRLKRQRSGNSDGISGWKSGLGMGRESTPGRRKMSRTTGSKSIGYQSTPQASTIRPSNLIPSSSPSASLASLPDPDDTQSSSLNNAMSIPSPGISPIPKHRNLPEDVFGIMSFIYPSRSAIVHDSHRTTMISLDEAGTIEELTIPVNFPSSEIHSKSLRTRGEDLTIVETARGVLAGEDASQFDFFMPLNNTFSESGTGVLGESQEGDGTGYTIRGREGEGKEVEGRDRNQGAEVLKHDIAASHGDVDTVTHDDLTITLNDNSDPSSKRLTAVLMSVKANATRLTASQSGSRTKNRVSTPYRRFSQMVPSTPEDKGTSVDLFGSSTRMNAVNKQGTVPPDDNYKDTRGGSSLTERRPEDVDLDSLHFGNTPYRDANLSPGSVENLPSHLVDAQSPDLSGLDKRLDCERDVSGREQGSPSGTTHSDPDPDVHSVTRASPSYSATFPPLVYGVYSPVPFVPSSQLGTPLRLPAVSPFSSSSLSTSRYTSSGSSTPEGVSGGL